MSIKKEIKGNYSHHSPAFGYFVPEINKTIKVERVQGKTYVAHFGDRDLERVSLRDMKQGQWECKGRWELINENV